MKNDIIEAHYRKNYKQLVSRTCGRVPHNSRALAEEVVQEAYAVALRYSRSFDPERGSFGAWFSKILNKATSKCIQAEQGHPTLSFDDDDLELEPFLLNEEVAIPREIVVGVQDAIKKQKPEVADVLNMFFNLGMNSIDIEKCTELTHTNIRQIIRRFRIKWDDENIF